MTITDPHAVLITHDRWANRQMYEACRPLNAEQFHQKFEMGCGSVHDNLLHNLGAMRGWTDVLNQAEQRPRLETTPRTLEAIIELHDEVAPQFESAALQGAMSDVLTRQRDAKTYTFTRGGILTHVTTHSMHHRAQCLNMLRHLGMEQLPMSSVMEWMLVDPDGHPSA